MAEQDSPPPTITAMKIPIIKKGEYDIWSMRMRQYICHTDHNLWDIIVDGDLQEEAAPAGEQYGPPAPKTAKQLTAKRNQERVKSILLLAIPDEYLLNQLEVHAAPVSKEDINQKFPKKLHPRWSHEDEMKSPSSSTSNSQNLAFLSSENTSSADEVVCSFFAQQTTSPPLDNEDLQQIDQDDLEELDIRWQVRSSDEEITLANDRFSKEDGYHVIPPPITGNFLTLRADISFAGLDEYAIRKKIIESKTTELNTDTSKSKTSETVGKTNEVNIEKPKSAHESVMPKPNINKDKVIIEDWYSDDEDDVSEVDTVSPVKTNETQTVKTQVDKIGQISQKEGIGIKKIKACFVYVKTSGVKNMTTAGTRAVVNTGKGKMDNDLKKSRWVWRPKGNYMDHESKEKGSFILKKFEYVDPKGIS
ncbi:hypothetical protein Tco_0626366 [Tanacetum coccineum]|uniref:Uncharacterized protein n=1 Tax=Tanacetum coccineum TaxID=301880 RepID=A0ABQ4WJE4_9ASTR